MEEELRKLLKRVPRYYEDFETGIYLCLKDDNNAMSSMIEYLKKHPDATISEISDYAWEIGDQTSDDYEDE